MLPLVVAESRAVHLDTEEDFARAELMLSAGMIRFPWMESHES
jgi:hypothetical protein